MSKLIEYLNEPVVAIKAIKIDGDTLEVVGTKEHTIMTRGAAFLIIILIMVAPYITEYFK